MQFIFEVMKQFIDFELKIIRIGNIKYKGQRIITSPV